MWKLIEKSINAMAFTDQFKFAVLLDVSTISQTSTVRKQINKVKTRVWCLSSYSLQLITAKILVSQL